MLVYGQSLFYTCTKKLFSCVKNDKVHQGVIDTSQPLLPSPLNKSNKKDIYFFGVKKML